MKKRWNEVLEYLTTWMNFKNTILSKKKKITDTPKVYAQYFMTPFMWNTQSRQIYRNKVD